LPCVTGQPNSHFPFSLYKEREKMTEIQFKADPGEKNLGVEEE